MTNLISTKVLDTGISETKFAKCPDDLGLPELSLFGNAKFKKPSKYRSRFGFEKTLQEEKAGENCNLYDGYKVKLVLVDPL